MNVKQVAPVVMSSTAIYCASVAILFSVTYAIVLVMYPEYSTNQTYLKSIGIVSLILIADDVLKFFTHNNVWAKITLFIFGACVFSLSMVPLSLFKHFSFIETIAIAITPVILSTSLFKYVGISLEKRRKLTADN